MRKRDYVFSPKQGIETVFTFYGKKEKKKFWNIELIENFILVGKFNDILLY